MIRRQLPAFSPLPLSALLRSAVGSRSGAEDALRTQLREQFRVEDALLCGSGTQALQLALVAACSRPEGANDLVALPAYTCYDVASAAIGANVRVTFYDVDPETLAPDMESLTRALERGPAAVVIAPLFGYQPDWDALRALTTQHDVMLVEDAAQSIGARWRGGPVGGLGDLSVLSFGRGKGWTAVEGGALLGPRGELARLSASLPPARPGAPAAARILLKGLAQWGFGRPALYGVPSMMPGLKLGETVFHAPIAPHGISPLSARLAVETAEASAVESEAVRACTTSMMHRLTAEGAASFRLPRTDSRSEPGGLRFPVLVSSTARPRVLALGRALGIMPSYPRPLPELAPLSSRVVGPSPYPGAQTLAGGLVTLPTHSLVSQSDLGRILALLRDADG